MSGTNGPATRANIDGNGSSFWTRRFSLAEPALSGWTGTMLGTPFPMSFTPFGPPIKYMGKGVPAVNSTANTSCKPGIPDGLTDSTSRMYMFVSIFGDKTGSLNTPSGWTKLFAVAQSTNQTLVCYAKLYSAGEVGPTVTWTTTNKNSGIIVAYNNVDLNTPEDITIDSTCCATGANTTNPTDVSKTAVTMGAWRLHIVGMDGVTAATTDTRMVNRHRAATTASSGASLDVDDEGGMAAGATGTRTSTYTTSNWIAATVWLRPAAPSTFGVLQSNQYTDSAASSIHTLAFRSALTKGTTLVVAAGSTVTGNDIATVKYTAGNLSFTEVAGAKAHNVSMSGGTGSYSQIFYYQLNTDTSSATVTVTLNNSSDISFCILEIVGARTTGTLIDTSGNNVNTATGVAVTAITGTTTAGAKLAIGYINPWDAQSTSPSNVEPYIMRSIQLVANFAAMFCATREFVGSDPERFAVKLSDTTFWDESVIVLNSNEGNPTIPFDKTHSYPHYRR